MFFLKEDTKKNLFWVQYDSKDIQQYSTKNSLGESSMPKNEEKQKLINAIKKLADDFYKRGKYKESFVLYVELLGDISGQMGKVKSSGLGEVSVDSEQILFEDIKDKALKIKATLKNNESVKNPLRLILDHVIERGISGAEYEKKQDWSAATDQYFNGLSCLNYLENYCSKHGTVYCQNEVFKYTDLFKQRHTYAKNQRDKITSM